MPRADIVEPVQLSPEHERRYLLHGISEFLVRAGAAQPMLLVFEDLHWADASTCALITQLAPRLADSAVLVIGTYRDNEVDPASAFGAPQTMLRTSSARSGSK